MKKPSRLVFLSIVVSTLAYLAIVAVSEAKSGNSEPFVHFDPQISNPYVGHLSDKEMLVNMRLWGDDFAPAKRPPVNLVLVIDESGSMNERGKMTYARQAAKDLVSKLNGYDRVGIVAYSDYSRVVHPVQKLNDKTRVLRLIDTIHPTNSTNLSSGLIEGISQLQYNTRNGYVNKVILLSDGLANRGITDIGSLSQISARSAEDGIYITTMGLGLSYDEDLMMSIAECGAGNYYFIESPEQMAYIFNKEFRQTTSTIAKDVVIELKLGIDVELVEVYGYTYNREGRKVRLNLGNMYSGQERNIKMRLRVPAEKEGKNKLMRSVLTYRDINDNQVQSVDHNLAYHVTADTVKVEKNEKKEIIAEVRSAEAAKDLDKATRVYESGDRESALSKIKEALGKVQRLNQSPYKSDKTVEQEEALNDAYRSMASEPSPASPGGKSLIKKYKAESREQQK